MEPSVYERESQLEADHWWFAGRRHLFRKEVEALRLARDSHILDVGSGTGTNLRLLRDMGFSNIVGLDSNPLARRFCSEKGLGEVQDGDIRRLPFPTGSFDMVLATDVVEHVEEHDQALAEICRVLKPGGTALLTVPAFMSLWGFQDKVAHHVRRYRQGPFVRMVEAGGLKVAKSYYFNFVLFAPIWLARQVVKIIRPNIQSENDVNNPWLNALLTRIFRADTAAARWVKPPFGVSLLVIASK